MRRTGRTRPGRRLLHGDGGSSSRRVSNRPGVTSTVVPTETFTAVIEILKGGRNKYEYDHETHAIKLDRFLFASVVYPTYYGFIPGPLSLHGDALDVIFYTSEPYYLG